MAQSYAVGKIEANLWLLWEGTSHTIYDSDLRTRLNSNSPGAAAPGTIILAISIHQFHHSRAAKGLVDIQSLKKSI